MDGEYRYDPDTFEVTDKMLEDYNRLGYIIVRGLLDSEEMALLKRTLEGSDAIMKNAYQLDDGLNKAVGLCIWSHPGHDVTGMIIRSEKLVRTSEKLIGRGEVYHYHTKITIKEPKTGGSFRWHQDYGYWYQNGNLFPDLNTVYIAYDKNDPENGCMQILEGSHKAGRQDHHRVGGQNGIDEERVQHLAKMCPLKYVELEPGDALIFCANLIHKSDANNSDRRRWSFLVSYNAKSNNPVYEHHHPQYTPLDVVPNSAIKSCTNFTDMTGKGFLDPSIDKTVIADKTNPVHLQETSK
ncbi:phytanoyl-CoA dioxygenase domain-containing protein 1 homolog [Lingula anatina]|uniref:Phytanoyl-CoA dioxygenase domain-containing protein 1 homolog n=1 Tax=Lingula anatina TaxID=7574 RepID=A0A1S3H408_LINAN|nr:phytanoyl-CoA dioxygenase domain-containing protein 1 homolog [Lingula anatina]|eukprot:XP_013380201.1 phytanoyl-CoA dioxygenase domain-containing protein 1 homolog [Lingula anatina]